jgi:hypothetical protein
MTADRTAAAMMDPVPPDPRRDPDELGRGSVPLGAAPVIGAAGVTGA